MFIKTNNNQAKIKGNGQKKGQKNLSCTRKTKRNQAQKITTKNKTKNSYDEWDVTKA